jgi:hypothetical protein
MFLSFEAVQCFHLFAIDYIFDVDWQKLADVTESVIKLCSPMPDCPIGSAVFFAKG